MTPDAPEFRTKASTPLCPFPVHPPEPSNIPVLRNQTDPIFNMTSTHLEPAADGAAASDGTLLSSGVADLGAAGSAVADKRLDGDDNSDDSSLSDPFDDDDLEDEEQSEVERKESEPATEHITEDEDNYAMTFDSDGPQDGLEAPKTATEDDAQPAAVLTSSTMGEPVPDEAAVPAHDIPSMQGMEVAAAAAAVAEPATPAGGMTSVSASAVEKLRINTNEDITNGGIDIQQLLDNITASASDITAAPVLPSASGETPSSYPTPVTPSLSTPASLPPRPQGFQNQAMQHPHAQFEDGRRAQPSAASYHNPSVGVYRAPAGPSPLAATGAPGTFSDARSSLPPPPQASFQTPSALPFSPSAPSTAAQPPSGQPQASGQRSRNSISSPDDPDAYWGPDVQKLYDDFLTAERSYVTEGLWDRFPKGSRLFIGNLPTEKVTKRDLFHVFHKYGRLAQISLKQAYGFVQFHDGPACYSALESEQASEVRGRKMHLEISKPQKNTNRKNDNGNSAQAAQKTRSPDHYRGSAGEKGGRGNGGGRNNGHDRYNSRDAGSAREAETRSGQRTRDDYRPRRSTSPARGGYRERDDYGRNRDFYDGRERRRSRSRSPGYGRRDGGRYRERSISPRGRELLEDADLQIPRRDARDVPDVQIILMDDLDRGYVNWVDNEFRGRGVKTDVMFLSSRLPLTAVVRRQILEGVFAVTQLTRRSQDASKVPLQVFDRTGGASNVRFDEYRDLEPKIAAELVLRAKSNHLSTATYAQQPQYPPAGIPYQAVPQNNSAAPNISNLVSQLDNTTMQKLLSALNAPQQPSTAATPLDLAGLLGGFAQKQPQQATSYAAPQQQQQQQHQNQPNPYEALINNPALASILGGGAAATQAQQHPQSAQQVQDIMAQLAKYRQ